MKKAANILLGTFLWCAAASMTGAQVVTIVNTSSTAWSYMHPVDGGGNGFDPQAVDGDFNATWFDPAGTFNGGAPYNGPAFTTGAQAPFEYGGVDGIAHHTLLTPTPNSGTRGAAYFLLTIDGGAQGYHGLELDMLADDGAFIYINGQLVADDGMPNGASDTWNSFASTAANESTFDPILLTGFPVLNPGPNLLAISIHQANATSSDLGFDLVLRGVAGPPPLPISRGPYLQKGAPDEVTIRWRTLDPASSTVRFGSAPGSLTNTVTVPGSVTEHIVPLSGLSADTQYFYAIESIRTSDGLTGTAGADADHYFITAPLPGTVQPVRIWAIGDSGTGGDGTGRAESVYEAYRTFTGNGSTHTDAWLMLGDNAYNSGTDGEYQNAVFNTYPELLRNTLLWPTIGNHDAVNTLVYLDTFSLPTGAEAGGVASGTELYYSYDYADIHFICLDSQTNGNYNTPLGSGMYAWLENDLMATTQNWIIAYFHHGPYTKGSHNSDTEGHHIEMRTKATMLLEDHGVDLVLYGHSHCYERSMLIDGHYGSSNTFDPVTMAKDTGNGSDAGGVDASGNFIPGAGDGAYAKPLATPNEGAIYITAGSSGKLSNWANGSSALVNPEPHPVMIVNLRLLGSMVIDVTQNEMHARFLDNNGNIRDDFTILKGSTVILTATDPESGEFGGDRDVLYEVSRTGATGLPLTVNFTVGGSAANGVDYTPALGGAVSMAAGDTDKEIKITRIPDAEVEGDESVILTLQPDGAYLLGAPVTALGTIHDKPADAWRFAFFGGGSPPGSGWLDDLDGDGVITLFEYGLGGDPTVLDISILPVDQLDGGLLKMFYHRDNSIPDLIYRATASTGLTAWSAAGVTDVVSGPPDPGGVEMREASIPTSPDGKGFLRLELELVQ